MESFSEKGESMKFPSEIKMHIIALFCLILVGMVRFNGNQLIVKQQPYDAKYFNAYVSYFKGEVPAEPIRPASNWRFLLPLAASCLPFSAPTSLNIINLLCLAGALFFFNKTLKLLKTDTNQRWLAIGLFIFSFPTCYYSTISYVDPGSVFFVSLGIYFWIKENLIGFSIALIAGLMAKETILLLLPFAGMHALLKKNLKNFSLVVLLLVVYYIEYYWIRKLAPISVGEEREKFWQISNESVLFNFQRMHTWLSFFLTLGLIGLLFFQKIFSNFKIITRKPLSAAALAGFATALGLFFFSFISTVADGRIIWHAYFFMLLLVFEPEEKQIQIIS